MFYVIVWLCLCEEGVIDPCYCTIVRVISWFRGNGNFSGKNPTDIARVATTLSEPGQLLDHRCSSTVCCPQIFYFAVELCCLDVSCWTGLNLQKNPGALWFQIQRDRSHVGVRRSQCCFCCLSMHGWAAALKPPGPTCETILRDHSERRRKETGLWFISSRNPKKQSNGFFSFVADTKLHQQEHTSPSRSWQLPTWFLCPRQERE